MSKRDENNDKHDEIEDKKQRKKQKLRRIKKRNVNFIYEQPLNLSPVLCR